MNEPSFPWHALCAEAGWDPDAPERQAQRDAIAQRITELHEQGRSRWPTVDLSPSEFGRLLGRHLGAQQDTLATLAALHADLYLAAACEMGVTGAVEAFDAAFLGRGGLSPVLARFHRDAAFADDVAQAVRERLFLGGRDGRIRIAQYEGRSGLAAWVRVTIERQAINLAHSSPSPAEHPEDLEELAGTHDEELNYLKSRYRREVQDAMATAFAGLTAEEQTLLRLYHQQRLRVTRLAVMFRVTHSTIVRRIQAAQQQLGRATRESLHQRLQLGSGDLRSLMRLVRSQVGFDFLRDPQ